MQGIVILLNHGYNMFLDFLLNSEVIIWLYNEFKTLPA